MIEFAFFISAVLSKPFLFSGNSKGAGITAWAGIKPDPCGHIVLSF